MTYIVVDFKATCRDLNLRRPCGLEEGMSLILFEPNDFECNATAHFDQSRADPDGLRGAWVARFDRHAVRHCQLKKGLHLHADPYQFGSSTWARTRDLRINSPALYRLSY